MLNLRLLPTILLVALAFLEGCHCAGENDERAVWYSQVELRKDETGIVPWDVVQAALLDKLGLGRSDYLVQHNEADLKLLRSLVEDGPKAGLRLVVFLRAREPPSLDFLVKRKIQYNLITHGDIKDFALHASTITLPKTSSKLPRLYCSSSDLDLRFKNIECENRFPNSVIERSELLNILGLESLGPMVPVECTELLGSDFIQEPAAIFYLEEINNLIDIGRGVKNGIFLFNFDSIHKMESLGASVDVVNKAYACLYNALTEIAKTVPESPQNDLNVVTLKETQKLNLRQDKASSGLCKTPTLESCKRKYNNCNKHGECTKKTDSKGRSCYVCVCKRSKDSKSDSIYKWAGDSCQYKDISTMFNIFLWVGLFLVSSVAWFICNFLSISSGEPDTGMSKTINRQKTD